MGDVVSGVRATGWQRSLGLAVGDVLLVFAFVVAGEIRHGVDPLAQSGRVVGTALPFLLGWFVAAGVAGLFRRRFGPREAAGRAALAWVAAALVGVGLRVTPFVPGGFDPAFLLVATGVGLALLVPWRAGAAALERRRIG